MQTQVPEDNAVLMRRRAEISGDDLLKSAAEEITRLRADLDDALETLAAIHHYAGRVPKESIKAAVERVIPGLARKGEGE